MTWRRPVHWCCSFSTDVWVLTHRKGTCRVFLHVSAAWSWHQNHDWDRCAAVFIIAFVSTVLLPKRHVADIVSCLLHVLTHAGVRPSLLYEYVLPFLWFYRYRADSVTWVGFALIIQSSRHAHWSPCKIVTGAFNDFAQFSKNSNTYEILIHHYPCTSTVCKPDYKTIKASNKIIQFFIIYVPSQQPQGQLQTQNSVDKSNYFMNKHDIKSKTS
jgi:hypothetical protein